MHSEAIHDEMGCARQRRQEMSSEDRSLRQTHTQLTQPKEAHLTSVMAA